MMAALALADPAPEPAPQPGTVVMLAPAVSLYTMAAVIRSQRDAGQPTDDLVMLPLLLHAGFSAVELCRHYDRAQILARPQ